MDVLEIIETFLKQNGFDGLYHDDDCGCRLGELAPCGNVDMDCTPGVIDTSGCGSECYETHDFHIKPKPAPTTDTEEAGS